MTRFGRALVCPLFLLAATVHGQGTSKEDVSLPAFEVASVKLNENPQAQRSGALRPDRFEQTAITVDRLIALAYNRRPFDRFQIEGGPDWVRSDRYDVVARIEDGAGSVEALYLGDGKGTAPVYLMLRNLMRERFRLAAHFVTREGSVYGLVMARSDGKLGEKVRASDVDCDRATKDAADAIAKTGRPPAVPNGTAPPCSTSGSPGRMTVNDLSMERVASLLSSRVDRPVIDRTNFKGNVTFTLEWAAEDAARDAGGVSIYTAMQEQLGLRLEPQRGPVDVLVIDHIERPTAD